MNILFERTYLIAIQLFAAIEGVFDGVRLPQNRLNQDSVQGAFSIGFTAVGAASVIVLIIAGYQYIFSAGDPQKTKKAKDAILYALAGLLVAMTAVTITAYFARQA